MGIINRKTTLIPRKSKEVALKNKNKIFLDNINVNDLPEIISEQVQKINELDERVKDAINKAEKADTSAKNAKEKSAGFGKKKAAIESLQDAGYDLAQAVMSGAEAQKISFEFQTKLAEIIKFLLNLGAGNIVLTRAIIKQLQLIMDGSSKTELSELAKKEMIELIKQLKAQEDILLKQKNLEEGVKQHEKIITGNVEKIGNIIKKISGNTKKILSIIDTVDNHDNLLSSLKRSIRQIKRDIKSLDQANIELMKKYKLAFFIISVILCVTLALSIISFVMLVTQR
jgi:hypothetical protein